MTATAIANRLLAASALYYNPSATHATLLDGSKVPVESMTDATFDSLEAQLRKLDPNHPVLGMIGAPPDSGWPKVKHPIVMASLEKAQELESLLAWCVKMAQSEFLWTEKLDGISILLTYRDGELVRAETRGDKTEGEDITRNVRVMKGVLPRIAQGGEVYIRGEVILLWEDFQTHFKEDIERAEADGRISNPRNTASGTAKRQSGWQKCRHLTVKAYNYTDLENPSATRSDELRHLEALGFETPNWGFIRAGETTAGDLYQRYIEDVRPNLGYDIDGLVIEINHTEAREEKGTDSYGTPKGAVAFKFPHQETKTTLREIVWQVGNSGRLTPVALFDKVPLAGAMVGRATLHNIVYLEEKLGAAGLKLPHVGDEIMVSRRNDVIPQVESFLGSNVEGSSLPIHPPTCCPVCDAEVERDGRYTVCVNDLCEAHVAGSILRWVSKLNILNLGGTQVRALIDAGLIQTIPDLYMLTEEQVAECEYEDGRKIGGNARRIMASLENSKEVTLAQLVGSVGIPLCGRRVVSFMVDAGFDSLEKLAEATEAELTQVPGIGDGRAQAFRKGFDDRRNLIVSILGVGVTIQEPEVIEVTGNAMEGKVVCMTGFRDNKPGKPGFGIGDAIAAQGGEASGSWSSKTNLLIAKDPSKVTGKVKKAVAAGIEVITIDEMWARLGGNPHA